MRLVTKKIIPKQFFERPTLTIARNLLGKFLIRKMRGNEIAHMITEIEAYDGPRDKASHAHRGKTTRNYVMFGEAGRWYVYRIYGIHWMLNIVTGQKNYPAAILIRGLDIISGPARVTRALVIDKRFNNTRAVRQTGLWIEDKGIRIAARDIKESPRIGVDYAQEWKNKPYRFCIMKATAARRFFDKAKCS